MPQPHPTETETTVGLDGPGYLAQYQIRGVSPNAVDLRVFLAFGTVQTEETKTFINSKGFIIALMKSKSLQLQSNKSKKKGAAKTLKTEKKNALLCTVSIPWKCVWRCSSGSRMKGNKTEMYHWTLGEKTAVSFFFSFFELYQSEYHCYSKIVSLVLFGGTRLAMSAVSDTRWPVNQSVSQWVSQSGVGWGSVH